jgi:hypothetical protein
VGIGAAKEPEEVVAPLVEEEPAVVAPLVEDVPEVVAPIAPPMLSNPATNGISATTTDSGCINKALQFRSPFNVMAGATAVVWFLGM